MQVFCVGDERKKDEQRESVNPPERLAGGGMLGHPPGGHVSDHEDEDEKRDEAGFVRQGSEPLWADHKSAESEAGDRDGAEQRKQERKPKIKRAEKGFAAQQREAEAGRDVADSHEGEGAKAPEHEGVSKPRQRALANYLGLAQYVPKEIPDAAGDGVQLEIGIGARVTNTVDDLAKSQPKQRKRNEDEREKYQTYR